MRKFWMLSAVLIICLFACLLSGCGQNRELSIAVMTDPHFAGREHHDYSGTYLEVNDSNGSGKQMRYLDDVLDAFIEQLKAEKPDCLLITGDLSYIGAKASHISFTQKLAPLREAGIDILVIPGNHDIVPAAYTFPDGEPAEAEALSPEDFAEVYADFGYSGALSRDSASLSYVHDTGKGVRIFMLDTNFKYGTILGELSRDTMNWLEAQLADCVSAGDRPLVAGHHNLLVHNRLFSFGYCLGNAGELEALLTEYGAELYLSGHIHVQHISQGAGIADISTESFALYPHRYGCVTFAQDGFSYESRTSDVAKYAEAAGLHDENLRNYDEYGYRFFYNNAYTQALSSISEMVTDQSAAEALAKMSAEANVFYFGGDLSQLDTALAEEFFKAADGTRWGEYIGTILEDTSDQLIWPKA